MPDIMKFIVNEGALDKDPAGNLIALNDWSEDIARKLASEMKIELKADHWEVINFLRDLYRQQGQPPHARDVLHALEERFEKKGGRKHLYLLFPGGAVTQGSRIAGLPVPKDSTDPSFGTAI
jgi:tRNA 2-thiouridine synthesizing protein E